jgi:predicted DNA-binding protein with PD1-like motif
MKYLFDGFNYFVRFDKGEQLLAGLVQFASENKLDGAWLSIIGGALEMELGFYELETKTYQWQKFTGLYEIVSLQGNLAIGEDGQPIFHLHGVFSDSKYQTIGGHVKELVVGGTCEVFVHCSDGKTLNRKHDPQTGLNLLDL